MSGDDNKVNPPTGVLPKGTRTKGKKAKLPIGVLPEGTPTRDFVSMFSKKPNIEYIQALFSQISVMNLSWENPQGTHQQSLFNVCLRDLDNFIEDFDTSRKNDEFEQFKDTHLRKEFASKPDNEILKAIAELAQTRAEFINYVLAIRVVPLIHQHYFNRRGDSDPTNRVEKKKQYKDRGAIGKIVIGQFWGNEASGNPLPGHGPPEKITNWRYWADPIDVKLTVVAPKLNKKFVEDGPDVEWKPSEVVELF
ncbi:hypothetical protein F4804DRAFT_2741 [Jackrogersella minutella]|nr:hypothetical protein F4804DRAFT_2741 [Jackrogersella minutella]